MSEQPEGPDLEAAHMEYICGDGWEPIESAPDTGTYVVKGGHYDTAYSQMHGFPHERATTILYKVQSNPDVDSPFRVVGEVGLGIEKPTHWKPK